MEIMGLLKANALVPTVLGWLPFQRCGPAASPCTTTPRLQDQRIGQQRGLRCIPLKLRLDWSPCVDGGAVVLLVKFMYMDQIYAGSPTAASRFFTKRRGTPRDPAYAFTTPSDLKSSIATYCGRRVQ